ncbi:hypothetical protein ACIQRS_15700 [Streptomyces termitum]|uniref:Uncharacterized protein n=1 Tax=Streptomyces termitum TaxID=67368 RepID=A0A918T822_9ACTN|nr:hypothetical protein [Streptomyces termitum]GHB09626.1 hypothetical protein GCM10010305_60600 [Streptomyces termitum]
MARGGDQDGSPVPDEEWERFLRESVEGVADAPVEPSARARERKAAPPVPPEGWRTPAAPVRRARRGTGWYVAGFVAAVALLAVALFPQWIVGRFGGDDGGGAPLAAESERPTGAPAAGADQRPTRAEPFRGSPAARWADGAAGITVPAAKATGWMDAAQVGRALESSRDFLAAAGLDRGVLAGGHPTRAVALLNPHQKDVREYLRAALSGGKVTPSTDPLLLFSRFRPDRARPAGDVVKTRGRLTYREGKRGAVEVTADVTFVYPVVPAADDGPDAEVVRTIVRREIVLSWDDPEKVVTEPGTASLVSYASDRTNGGCGDPTGYFEPPFGEAGAGPADGRPEVDPYGRTAPIAPNGGARTGDCAAASRS